MVQTVITFRVTNTSHNCFADVANSFHQEVISAANAHCIWTEADLLKYYYGTVISIITLMKTTRQNTENCHHIISSNGYIYNMLVGRHLLGFSVTT